MCLFVFRDGCRFLRTKPDLLAALFALTSDPSIAIVKDCYYIFVNLSADETLHQVISELLITQLTNKNKTQTTVRLNRCAGFSADQVKHVTSVCFCVCVIQVLVADVKILPVFLKNLEDPEYPFSDQICTILSNLSRHNKTCKTVFKVIDLEMSQGLNKVLTHTA